MTAYLLDANVFIQSKNCHCGFDFCSAFWDWLVEQDNAGTVASIKKIEIPDTCRGLSLHCVNSHEMLRRERARFVLETNRSTV